MTAVLQFTMAGTSDIEWTEVTWNPVRGCSRVSEGCRHCYAERIAHRFSGAGQAYEGLTKSTGKGPAWNGKVRLIHDAVSLPLSWRNPRLVFVNSMSDLFHESVPIAFIQRVFRVMNAAPQHTFQVLTKRAERLAEVSPFLTWSPNIWMGVSVESEAVLDRVSRLRECEAHVKFLSIEPLIGPMGGLNLGGIHWVIVGGESGPGAREMKREWVTDIRDRCERRDVPFFFKQWGGVQKKKAGRLLDGREWNGMPSRA